MVDTNVYRLKGNIFCKNIYKYRLFLIFLIPYFISFLPCFYHLYFISAKLFICLFLLTIMRRRLFCLIICYLFAFLMINVFAVAVLFVYFSSIFPSFPFIVLTTFSLLLIFNIIL